MHNGAIEGVMEDEDGTANENEREQRIKRLKQLIKPEYWPNEWTNDDDSTS